MYVCWFWLKPYLHQIKFLPCLWVSPPVSPYRLPHKVSQEGAWSCRRMCGFDPGSIPAGSYTHLQHGLCFSLMQLSMARALLFYIGPNLAPFYHWPLVTSWRVYCLLSSIIRTVLYTAAYAGYIYWGYGVQGSLNRTIVCSTC